MNSLADGGDRRFADLGTVRRFVREAWMELGPETDSRLIAERAVAIGILLGVFDDQDVAEGVTNIAEAVVIKAKASYRELERALLIFQTAVTN